MPPPACRPPAWRPLSTVSAPGALRILACLSVALAAMASTTAASSNSTAAGDTWAVIVSSSRYWLNYRHTANALGVYQAVRRLGLPDSRILLMLSDQPACSPRNVHPGQLFLAPGAGAGSTWGAEDARNLLPAGTEVDYRGREVSVDSVLRVLTGSHPPGTPVSKRLCSGPQSRVLVYLTGHGGDEFLKFHDQEELLATDIAAAVGQMHAAGRYGQLLLLADTCQASTLFTRITAPGVLGVASSKLGQSSYAHHIDTTIGQHVVDQFTFYLHHFLTTRLPPFLPAGSGSSASASSASSSGVGSAGASRPPSLQQLLEFIQGQRMSSEVQVRADLFPRRLADVSVLEFFGQAPVAAGDVAAAAAGEAASTAGASGIGAGGSARPSSSNSIISDAATVVLEAAQRQGAATGAAKRVVDGPPSWQPAQQPQQQLFDMLAAAGGKAQAPSLAVPGRRAAAAAALAGAWAAAIALSRWLLLF